MLVVRANTANMKQTLILFGLLLVVTVVGLVSIPARRDALAQSVSVAFVAYTNIDTRGFSDTSRWAWFRVENKSPFMLLCSQGPLDIERSGSWIRNTNTLGRQNPPSIIEPGHTCTVSMISPSEGTRWRNTFLFTKWTKNDSGSWDANSTLDRFMDRLHLEKIGIRTKPWKSRRPQPYAVTSETLKL